jgi:integral membrane protein (TIGR01906 family)
MEKSRIRLESEIVMLKSIARILFIICIPFLLLSASIAWGFNSLWLYNYGFQKYNISRVTGLPPAELEKAATGLLQYFNSSDEYVNIQLTKDGKSFALFNREEQIHFKDVKQLVRLDYNVLWITLIYSLGFVLFFIFRNKKQYWRYLAGGLLGGGILTLSIMLLAGVGILVDFEGLFIKVHQLVFTNQFWSAQGYMLLLFPEGFWSDTAGILAGLTAISAVVLGIIGGLYLKLTNQPNEMITETADFKSEDTH